ncbi:MAG: FAD-dependent oxidoreductase [Pseudomonadota bacterium]
MKNNRFVVIGGDAAGMSAASLVKRRRPDLEIEAFEMGDYTSYGACGMPYYISGLVPELEDLVVVSPQEFREKRGITVHMRHRVEKIIPAEKKIEVLELDSGRRKEVLYDELLIATGAAPVVPPGIDVNLPGVFVLRGLPDAEVIKQEALKTSGQEAVVVGTGYIGMEMAEALAEAGLKVKVIGRRPQVMPAFEEEIAAKVQKELIGRDVEVYTGAEAQQVKRSDSGRLQVTLSGGRTLTADLIVIGTGVRPRSELAAEAGLELGVKKAIKVDHRQRTSVEHIWSAGDCAEAYHRLLGKNTYIPLALTANRQGRIVGDNIAGTPAEFPGILGTTICKVFDLTVARTGLGLKEAQSEGLDVTKVEVNARSRPHYYPGGSEIKTILMVERGNRKLWGAQMVGLDGVAHRINTWAAAIYAGLSLEDIHAMDLAYAPPYSPVWDPVLIAAEIALKQVK